MDSIATIQDRVAKNKAALQRAEDRVKALRKQGWTLDRELHWHKLAACVGQQVVPRYLGEFRNLEGKTLTLLEVRRTRCSIQVGDERYSVPIDRLLLAAEVGQQGFVLEGV